MTRMSTLKKKERKKKRELTSGEQESGVLFIYFNRQDFTWKNESIFWCANSDSSQGLYSSVTALQLWFS